MFADDADLICLIRENRRLIPKSPELMPFISEGQTLLILLVLLYLSECVIWMKRHSVAFISGLGGSGRVAFAHQWLGNANGGILFLNPLPPAGKVFLSHLSPISISPSGICAFNLQTLSAGSKSTNQSGRYLSFAEIKQASNDSAHLLVNKEKFTKCATAGQARNLATLISAMIKAASAKREALARSWIEKQFDVNEASVRLRDGRKSIKMIQSVTWIFFLFLFLVVPLQVSISGLVYLLLWVALLMIIFAVRIGTLYFRVHKRFYPEEKTERIESMVKMIVCPPASMRAADLLTRNLLAAYSPVVLAELLTQNRARQFVRAFVLDLLHPLKHEVVDENARSVINWTAAEQLKACLEYLQGGPFGNPEELLAPAQREGNSISYCPRCGCQFLVHSVDCPDCPGVALVAFADRIEVETGGSVSQTIPHG